MPARPAIATRWIIALVEPPSAICATSAFSKEARDRMSRGLRSSQIISTMRRPHWIAMRLCAESGAGIDEAPGSVMPSVSVSDIMVAAVPIDMQVPKERAMPASIVAPFVLGDACRPACPPSISRRRCPSRAPCRRSCRAASRRPA